jgi:hypothetical protein
MRPIKSEVRSATNQTCEINFLDVTPDFETRIVTSKSNLTILLSRVID